MKLRSLPPCWNGFIGNRLIGKDKNDLEKLELHFILLTVFLSVAHVIMIFGMVDPGIAPKPPAAK